MRTRKPLSIRNLLLLTVSALALLIAALIFMEVSAEWKRLVKIQSLEKAALISDHMFDAAEKLSVERDVVFSMLHAPDNETAQSLGARLERRRAQTDAALQATLKKIHAYDFSELTGFDRKLEEKISVMHELRRQIDAALTLPQTRRDHGLSQRWFDEMTAIALKMQSAWLTFITPFIDIDSAITRKTRFKYLLGVIMEYTGRERSLIGRLIMENASPTPKEQADLLRWQGSVDMLWDIASTQAAYAGLYPAIEPLFKDAQSHYSNLHGMVQDIFYVPKTPHFTPYPIGADLWFELTAQATESLYTLKEKAFQETARYMETLAAQEQRAITAHIMLLLFAVFLCGYSFYIVVRRVIRPIDRIVDALTETRQGRQVSLMPSAVNQGDEIGKLMQVLTAFQQAAAERTRNENKLRAVVDNALDGLITINEQGSIESFNPAAERIFGYRAEEVVGKNIKMLMPEPYHSEHDGYLSRYLETGKAKIIGTTGREVMAKRKDGSVFPMDLAISAFMLEDGKHFSGIVRDITARKEAEREVRESEARYRVLVEASAQVIWVWKEGAIDKNSPLSQWWEKTTGQPSEAIATFGWLDVVHPDDRERVAKIWEVAMAERKDFDMEYRLRAKNGKYIHVAVRGVPLLDDKGEVREFIGSLNDVTARKEAEDGLQRYTQALERSNKELDDFAYIASHDLKEPLRGLHNHARFLLEDNQEKLDPESANRLDRLVHLSQRMERLVNDLLYFSRLGRQEMAIQPTDLNAVVRDIESMLETFLQERRARITMPEPLPTLVCDKPRITEALRNLITNAVKYNDKPERIVEVGFLPVHAAAHGKEKNVIYVRDNGLGIAPEFHQEIFRIFKRLQGAKAGEEEGTGVGLTFVKKIIDRHGGKIWLESEPGKGTVFYFTLEGASYDAKAAA